MSGYSDGRVVEYAAIDSLQLDGYRTVRAASSKGLADVVAIKAGQVLLVNCKRTKMPPPAERVDLLALAALLPGVGVPLVARKPKFQSLTFVRLTGPGPRDFVSWTADEVAS